jgi:hypothetical protein
MSRATNSERTTSITDGTVDDGPAQLSVTRILRADPTGLCAALDDPTWLGPELEGADVAPGLRRVETDLAFGLSSSGEALQFRKAAIVDLGVIAERDGVCAGRVEWRASSFAPLFPAFAGTVTVHDGGLHLDGAYAPPGGGVGLLIDKTVLHHVARRTAIWFLDRLIDRLASADGAER